MEKKIQSILQLSQLFGYSKEKNAKLKVQIRDNYVMLHCA